MEATKRIAWIATDVQKDRCDRTSNTYPDCESHVRSIVMDQGEPLICGSSARQPDCRKIHINQTDVSSICISSLSLLYSTTLDFCVV